MTAVNLIVQGQAAHLLTDTVAVREDGRIAHFNYKVITIPALRIAMAGTGYNLKLELCAAINAKMPTTEEEFLASLPSYFAAATAAAPDTASAEGFACPTSEDLSHVLSVAHWSRRLGRAVGFVIGNDNRWLGGAYRPYSLQPAMLLTSPTVDLGSRDITNPRNFDVRVNGLDLMETQRRTRNSSFCPGHHNIGGEAILTTVTAHGINNEVLKAWPDLVGQAISV